MLPWQVLATSGLLGVFAFMGGGYAVLYVAAMLAERRSLTRVAYACYAAQCACLLGVLWISPLEAMWKIFLVCSCAAYAVIPPITWRYLRRLHGA